ncbi:MAG: hypothetical protein ACK5DM_01705, partial [Planctomyces sp.]
TAAIHRKAELRRSGLTAAATVDLDLPGLSAAGVDFSVDGELTVNTGSQQAEVDVDDNPATPAIVIPAQTSTLQAGGALSVRVPQTQVELLSVQGSFLMIIDSSGLAVLATGQTSMLGLISLQVDGAFFIRQSGVAAEIDMALLPGTAASSFSSVFSFNVTATAVFNTTGQAQSIVVPAKFETYLSDRAKSRLTTVDGKKQYTVPAGAPNVDGTYEPAGAYAVFMMTGSATISSTFSLTGSYRMVIAGGRFEIAFDANMTLSPIGTVDASGILNISSAGVYGALQLGGKFQLGSLEIFGAMQLELNTRVDDVSIERIQSVFNSRRVSDSKVTIVLPASSQRIFVGGIVAFPGFELQGTFTMINNPSVISITVDASFRAFDALFLQAGGTFSIVKGANPGLVMNVGATLKSGFFGVDGVFDMDANFQLKVNTRSGGSSDQYDLGVARGMSRIDLSGAINLLSTIKLQASGFIESWAGVFRLQINGSMEVLSQHVYGSGYFSSEGEFSLSFGGSLNIGANGFGVFGSASFSISRLDNNGTEAFGDGNYQTNVLGTAQGSVQLFGLTLASASISFGLEGSTGRVYITPRIVINLLFTKIDVSTTFNLFYVKVPQPIYLAGNASDTSGQGFDRGTLYLNIGARAHMRNMSPFEQNEGFILTKIAPDPDYPGEIIRVQAFGRGQTFRGVTGIVADGGSGFDYISIGPGILSPVTLIGGDRKDWLLNSGSGDATIIGGDDDDEIKGGYGSNTFVFTDGFGRDTITSSGSLNTFDLSTATEDLTGQINSSQFVLSPSGYNRRTLGTAMLAGRPVELLPNSIDIVTGVLSAHGLVAGDRFRLSNSPDGAYDTEFTVSSATANTFTFSAFNFKKSPPAG